MKATIEMTDADRLNSSSSGSNAIVAINGESDQTRIGVITLSSWSRWYLTMASGEVIPLIASDQVGLFSAMKVNR